MLHELIRNARRRLLFNELLKQFAVSAVLAIAGLALLLTFGTRYLQWWVVALFAAGVLVWAGIKLRNKLPGDYAAAVWLDDKAGLHDALSTAHYFATSQNHEAEAILRAQREQAESVAGKVNIAVAVPFRFPKALYGLAALLLVSSCLIGLRYFYGHNLNLSAPLYEVVFQDLAAKSPAAKSVKNGVKPKDFEEAQSLLSKLGLGQNLDEKPDANLDEALADALRAGDQSPAGDEAGSPADNKGDPMDAPNTPQDNQDAASNDQQGADSQNGKGSPKQAAQSDKSLLSKLKDAMDSMIGKPADAGEKGEHSSESKSGGQQAQDTPKEGKQGGETAQKPGDGDASGDAKKSDTPGQTTAGKGEKTEGPAVAGADEGDKSIKAAAQLKAMGKISELIGKRSSQVTGESMMDVQSGDQKLRTAYKDKSAAHGEGTGEVSRDQIPLSEQEYVQQYFQQVRKPAK